MSARSPLAATPHALPPLFLVMATQNPIEQEGTFPAARKHSWTGS